MSFYKKIVNKKANWDNVPGSSHSPGYPGNVSDADINRSVGPERFEQDDIKETIPIDVNWVELYRKNVGNIPGKLIGRGDISTFDVTFIYDPNDIDIINPRIIRIEDENGNIYTDNEEKTENEDIFLILENYFQNKIIKQKRKERDSI